MIEDMLPSLYRTVAYHPSAYIYAWKRKDLEQLFKELNLQNIAITKFEVWLIDKGQISSLIPLKSGEIKIYAERLKMNKEEELFDFVERSSKDVLGRINALNLEKMTPPDISHKIWYHFEFITEEGR